MSAGPRRGGAGGRGRPGATDARGGQSRDGRSRLAAARSTTRSDHVIPGRQAVHEALRARRRMHELVVTADAEAVEDLVAEAHAAGVPVRRAAGEELDRLAAGIRHQGALARCPPYRYADLADVLEGSLLVVLDGLTDPRNLGAIARSAEAAGAAGLVVRERRGAGVTPAAEKASAGALSWLPVAQVTNLSRALSELAAAGWWRVGLDEAAAEPLWTCALLDDRVAIVIGGEGGGISRLVGEHLDARVRLPMAGRVGSLNASAAATLALFEVVRRRRVE